MFWIFIKVHGNKEPSFVIPQEHISKNQE